MIDTKYLHMPKHTPAFATYVADVENRLFVEAGLMPGGEEGFAFALAHRLIYVSRNCRTREGHKRLVEAAVRSLVQEHVREFVESRKQSQMTYWRHDEPPYVGKNEDDMLVADLIAIAGQHGFAAALQFYVEHWLFEDARRLFGEQCVYREGNRLTVPRSERALRLLSVWAVSAWLSPLVGWRVSAVR